MQRSISSCLALSALSVIFVAGCPSKQSEGDKGGSTTAASSAAFAASSDPAPKAAPSTSAASEAPGSLAADGTGALPFAWKIAKGQSPKVSVSAVVGDATIALGTLDASADDDANGTVETCSMKNAGKASSRLECGDTPSYNYLTANLTGGALVITLTQGIDDAPDRDKVTEVARRPTTATSLRATGPASPLLSGNCRKGYVQKTPDSVCMRQCLKGTECKSPDVCKMVDVTGGDGPHKVHACVPPGK